MFVYRLSDTKYASTVLSGIGARDYGGRWNSKGRSVVYAAGTISLAALETLAHVSMDNFPPMTLTTIDLPDELSIMELSVDSLPVEWTAYPAPPVLGELGDAWFDAGDTVALRVPSVIVPQEYNYLFNTNHPSFDDVMIIEQTTFEFDPRLYGAK